MLIDRKGRDPASRAGVVRAVDGEGRKLAVGLAAVDGTPDDDVMGTPAVVAALAVRGEGAGKVAGGEGSDFVAEAQLLHGTLEGENGLAGGLHEAVVDARRVGGIAGAVDGDLIRVGVVTTVLTEEDLAAHVEGGRTVGLNEACGHFELESQT